jgi:nucleoside-diphosphate-sugar epimerase
MEIVALVVGASGIAGRGVSQELIDRKARVHGLSRRPDGLVHGVNHVAADLTDAEGVKSAVAALKPTHVYLTTWSRQANEEENIRVNAGAVRTLLNAVAPARSVVHVALVTGLKHYLGPFDAYVTAGTLPLMPVREEQPRLDIPNFYYAQEDEVYAAAARDRFTWSVHRPHTIIGKAIGNAMNMGSTLAAYATICKQTGRTFKFPGSAAQWNGLSDMTDARILGKQLVWASTHDFAKNNAYNVVNGDLFRWNWLWPRIAKWFDVEWEGFTGEVTPLETQMANDADIWKRIAKNHELVESTLARVASPWHTDLDLSRPIEVMTDMAASRRLGFTEFQNTEDAFFDLFATLRSDKIIP